MSGYKQLPKGWEVKRLGEVGKIFNGNSINSAVKKEKYLNIESGIPYIATKDISYKNIIDYSNGVSIPFEEKIKFKFILANTILICSEGGSAGRKIGFTNQEVGFGNKLFALIPSKNIDAKYIYYFYFSDDFQKNFQSQITGIIGGVSVAKFKKLNIPFPPPPEQKRIVAILDKAFKAIDLAKINAEQNLKNAKELFESYLQNIFENKGDDWVEKKLGEVCIVARGSSPRPIKKYLTQDQNGVNWIKIGDTKNIEKYIYRTNQKITIEGAKKSRFVEKGDFILSNSMSFGKPYIMKTTGYIHDGWFKLKLYDFLNTEYFYQLLSSPYVNDQFHSLASGSVVKNISGDLVKKVSLPIPPLPEQKQIVKKLDALQTQTKKLETLYQQKINNLVELKKSVLQKAFAGELT